MGAIGKSNPRRVNSAAVHVINLFKQTLRVDDYAVTYNAGRALIQNSRRQETKFIFLAVYRYCVTGIGAALKSDNRVRLLCQIVDNFSFAFVAPLRTAYNHR